MQDLQKEICSLCAEEEGSLDSLLLELQRAISRKSEKSVSSIWRRVVSRLDSFPENLLSKERALRVSLDLERGSLQDVSYVTDLLLDALSDLRAREKRNILLGTSESCRDMLLPFLALRGRDFFARILCVHPKTLSRWQRGSRPEKSLPQLRFLARLLYELTEVDDLTREEALGWLEEPLDGGRTPYEMLLLADYSPPEEIEQWILFRR